MIGIGLRPRRSRFVCLIILLSSLILCIFRFRPSKAKWIGNVLTNRQNAASYLQRSYFWSTFVCCVIRLFQIKVSCWIAASVLKTERYCPRHYIDATMPLASLGKAQQYCSVLIFQLVSRGFFLQFATQCWLGASIGNAHCSAQTQTRIGLLEEIPRSGVQIPCLS
jgi:hypothetical protein